MFVGANRKNRTALRQRSDNLTSNVVELGDWLISDCSGLALDFGMDCLPVRTYD